ncbi:HAD family hydrolase [Haliangium sp.]|uniref:HAD family hydrolase n=1 Tax=Haliangium sp. TaxID=2663208 RepID=UPI003D0F0A63
MLILDFDGTVTDAEREGAPYRTGYLEDLALLTGRPLDEVHQRADAIEAEVRSDPDNHGWVFQGRVVAPAVVDPYLRILPTARGIFDVGGHFTRSIDRERLLELLYKYNYQKTDTAFRPGAYELLASLAGTAVYVVTNSHTGPVQDKIRALARTDGEFDWLRGRVHGRAQKYVIDDGFTEVDAELAIPGLGRPVLLRRRRYHDAIARLLESEGRSWSELLVVGDIFELDLALPLHQWARVALMANDFTPGYELDFLAAHPRGHVIRSLAEIPALLG